MTLNSTTRIGMTAGQVIWLLTVAATFTLGYADLNLYPFVLFNLPLQHAVMFEAFTFNSLAALF